MIKKKKFDYMMRSMLIVALFINTSTFSPLLESAEERNKCIIEDWRYSYQSELNWIIIEGSTSCSSGEITIRGYNDNQFLGIANSIIQGYAFSASISDISAAPETLKIKYSIH